MITLRLLAIIMLISQPWTTKSFASRPSAFKFLFRHFRWTIFSSVQSVDDGDVNISNPNPVDTNFQAVVSSRAWSVVNNFWQNIIGVNPVLWPEFIRGSQSSAYPINNMHLLQEAGEKGEFLSKDSRYSKRYTYAMQIGYVGSAYYGYQRQRVPKWNASAEVLTVESELQKILKQPCFCAGRTDRGVHAISQVVNFFAEDTSKSPQDMMKLIASSEASISGRLRAINCVRVPKKFNARSCATWRRYLYLFPLSTNSSVAVADNEVDNTVIDLQYLNSILSELVNKELSYFAVSAKVNPFIGSELSLADRCMMYVAKAHLIHLPTGNNIILDRDLCHVNLGEEYVICIELVGNRFLRQMVRVLVATALREAMSEMADHHQSPQDRRNDTLVDILQSGIRKRAAWALPPDGLCFAGVGYDYDDLAIYKFMPKNQLEKLRKASEVNGMDY